MYITNGNLKVFWEIPTSMTAALVSDFSQELVNVSKNFSEVIGGVEAASYIPPTDKLDGYLTSDIDGSLVPNSGTYMVILSYKSAGLRTVVGSYRFKVSVPDVHIYQQAKALGPPPPAPGSQAPQVTWSTNSGTLYEKQDCNPVVSRSFSGKTTTTGFFIDECYDSIRLGVPLSAMVPGVKYRFRLDVTDIVYSPSNQYSPLSFQLGAFLNDNDLRATYDSKVRGVATPDGTPFVFEVDHIYDPIKDSAGLGFNFAGNGAFTVSVELNVSSREENLPGFHIAHLERSLSQSNAYWRVITQTSEERTILFDEADTEISPTDLGGGIVMVINHKELDVGSVYTFILDMGYIDTQGSEAHRISVVDVTDNGDWLVPPGQSYGVGNPIMPLLTDTLNPVYGEVTNTTLPEFMPAGTAASPSSLLGEVSIKITQALKDSDKILCIRLCPIDDLGAGSLDVKFKTRYYSAPSA